MEDHEYPKPVEVCIVEGCNNTDIIGLAYCRECIDRLVKEAIAKSKDPVDNKFTLKKITEAIANGMANESKDGNRGTFLDRTVEEVMGIIEERIEVLEGE